ncbi:MAG: peptidyl-prolyl cis-trans isomerase [Phycisphaeraceae bacterium]|nr:peptidyl-prolyl cis-trans isomerase [Phycisphaeraceae bacterium]
MATTIGCQSRTSKPEQPGKPESKRLTPDDFVATPAEQAAATTQSAATASATQAAEAAPSPIVTPAAPSSDPTADDLEVKPYEPSATPPKYVSNGSAIAVEAMIGQVNGHAIYARQVFKDIDAQLTQLGQRLPRSAFRQRAKELLELRLRQIVMDALILGEAEGNLNEQQRYGLLNYLKLQREELVRQWGLGSETLTNERLRSQEGIGLEQKMEETRQKVLVQSFLRQKLYPKINVTRKDIERFYQSNPDRFNPPPGRTIYLIRTSRKTRADDIDRALTGGKAFLDVAGDATLNEYKASDQGLFGKGVKGEQPFGIKSLNDALIVLREDQHSTRITVPAASGGGEDQFYWIYVKAISTGQGKPLREVQLDIEQELRKQQYQRLTEQYQKKLFDEGSYNPLDQMLAMLLNIALNVYANPQ